MSEESRIVLDRLKGRIDRIISSYESAVFENRELKEKLANSQQELETSKKTIISALSGDCLCCSHSHV